MWFSHLMHVPTLVVPVALIASFVEKKQLLNYKYVAVGASPEPLSFVDVCHSDRLVATERARVLGVQQGRSVWRGHG